jgi:hypothetical protein
LPAGYLLQIEDQGLGMTDEQLVKVNQRLARPPDIDSRVPMVHVPLRRPQGPVQPGPAHGLPGMST